MTKTSPTSIQTYSGAFYDFQNPDPRSIHLRDIAHALSNACRFAGHTARFYSVAEHSVRVSRILQEQGYDERTQRIGLLHDAHEAYVWDCPRPFKPLLGEVYKNFAERADRVIAEKFGRARPEVFHEPPIKEADDIALVAEARALMNPGPTEWVSWEDRYSKVPEPPRGTFRPGTLGWTPRDAEAEFYERARELGL
jgi:hypothetical protein